MTIADSNAFSVGIVTGTGPTMPSWYPVATQQWMQISGTNLHAQDYTAQLNAGLCADAAGTPRFSPTYGDPRSGILAYSGGAIRKSGSELLIFGGGGATAWGGNEIRSLPLESGTSLPRWVTRKNPASAGKLWTIPASQAHAYMQDGVTPNARHSYWSPVFHDAQDRFYAFGVQNVWEWDGWPPYPTNLDCDMWQYGTDATTAWAAPGTVASVPNPRGWDGPWVCKHATTEKIYFGGQSALQEYTPATNTWATRYTNSLTDLERRVAAIDHTNNILLTIGQDNAVQDVGNAFDMTTSPFTKYSVTWTGTQAANVVVGASHTSGYQWGAGFIYCPDLGCFLLYRDDGNVYTITRTDNTHYAVEPLSMSGTPPPPGTAYGSVGGQSILWGRMQYVPNLHGVVMLLNATSDVWFFRTA